MLLFDSPIAFWACFATVLTGVSSAPDLAFPVNSQVPPVAYASQAYQYSFSESTFRSDAAITSYSLAGAPVWLILNSNQRRFEGRPAPSDVGSSTFELRAVDGRGESSSQVTLVVLDKATIGPGTSIIPYLEDAGAVSPPSTLLLKPLAPFSIKFPTAVFSGTSSATKYYAISQDGSPLPSWIQFDPMQLTLSGTTLPLVSVDTHQQIYGISLIASNVPGFSEAVISFQIAIAYKTLAFVQQSLLLNVTPGNGFQSPPLLQALRLDGQTIDFSELSSVTASLPTWLQVETGNIVLSGVAPSDFQTTALIIVARDVYGSTANLTLDLRSDTADNTITRPTISPSAEILRSQASSSTSPRTSSLKITTTNLPVPTEQTDGRDEPDEGRTKPRHIILLAVVPVFSFLFVLICIIVLVCCLRRRFKRRRLQESGKAPAEEESEPQAQGQLPDIVDLPQIGRSSREVSVIRSTPTQAPKVDLPWAPDSLQKTRARLSKRQKPNKLGSFDSSWSGLVAGSRTKSRSGHSTVTPSELQPHEPLPPMPMPILSARPQSSAKRTSSSRKKQNRRSKVLSEISNPQNRPRQRVSGAGHGAGILPVDNPPQRSSWQTTLGSIPMMDSRPSTAALDSFPTPPTESKENKVPGSTVSPIKPSLRIVDSSSEALESFEMQRQQWHTERARARLEGVARFSNAQTSRSHSLPRAGASSALSSSRTLSPTIPENEMIGSRARDPSWSRWSGVRPAGRRGSPLSAREPAPLFARERPAIAREISITSSGQFDSAVSSEFQWEDENLVAEINEAGERQWHTDTESAAPSPRLPFEPFTSQEDVGSFGQAGLSRGARIIDRRRRVSVDNGEIHRSERSHMGSFRFI